MPHTAPGADRASIAPTTAPADVYRTGLRLLLDKDIAGWVDLWADDAVFEFPFAPPGAPRRLVGKDAVRAYMADYPDHIDLRDFPDLTVHETADPAMIVVEMRAVGRVVPTDRPYEMTYVAVVTVTDGLIRHYRDYWNPLVALDAVGGSGASFVGAA